MKKKIITQYKNIRKEAFEQLYLTITQEINDNIDQIDFEQLIDYYIDNIY